MLESITLIASYVYVNAKGIFFGDIGMILTTDILYFQGVYTVCGVNRQHKAYVRKGKKKRLVVFEFAVGTSLC